MKCLIKYCLILSLFTLATTFACTDIRLIAKDGTVLITRSMEFAQDLQSNLRISPRGREFKTLAPDGQPGMSWTSKYGYVYLDGMNVDVNLEGMSDQGLSFEALLFPGTAGYQTVAKGQNTRAIPYFNLGDYILGNFKSLDEVRAALPSKLVTAEPFPGLGEIIFPLHFSVFDAKGNGLVIEYVNGQLTMYDNKIGVFTNSPEYSWHTTNLRNYINLSPSNPDPVKVQGITFTATGQGAGMVGLPGDISPPSRFVKMAIMQQTVLQMPDAAQTLNLAQHMINNVDIPLGFVRENGNGAMTNDLTQWVVFKDLTHQQFYYRTYDDLTLHAVDLTKLNFNKGAPLLKIPLKSPAYSIDMTQKLLSNQS